MFGGNFNQPPDPSLPLPRILCLHGGGVNAKVFRWQCRSIIRSGLTPHFRFVFADAPFECDPHPAIVQVYGEHGPFYRWLRWLEDHEEVSAHDTCRSILGGLQSVMDKDEGTGEWVGVLGFSQGAKIAGSLLWSQEFFKKKWKARQEKKRHLVGWGGPFGAEEDGDDEEEVVLLRDNKRGGKAVDFKFGVCMAGSAPTVMLDPRTPTPWQGYGYEMDSRTVPRYVETADKTSLSFSDWPSVSELEGGEHVITLPTLHVHGLLDPGIERHRKLLELYCQKGTTRLVEWMGDHRLPIKMTDVEMVVKGVLEIAKETGLL
ncbi:citrinin biosynthesis oxidoreductase CtnB [Naviculisporaceae sp. PSN 640]